MDRGQAGKAFSRFLQTHGYRGICEVGFERTVILNNDTGEARK